MKLAVVSLIRNEADVVETFLRHLGRLFDHAVLMDHGSSDGTSRYLAAAASHYGWQHWHVAVPGYHQQAFTTFALRHVFEHTDADYVFLLDADEFLDVPDRATLEAGLMPLAGNPRVVGHLGWRNCVKLRASGPLGLRTRFWMAPEASRHCKTILPRGLYEASGGQAHPTTGNHDIIPGDGVPISYHRVTQLLHFPIRSLQQLRLKAVCGTLSTIARTDRPLDELTHWFAMVDRMSRAELSEADLIDMVAGYGAGRDPGVAATRRDLQRRGFVSRRLDSVAHDSVRYPSFAKRMDPLDIVAAVLRDWRQLATATLDLRLSGNVLENG